MIESNVTNNELRRYVPQTALGVEIYVRYMIGKLTFDILTGFIPLCALSDHYKMKTERPMWWLSRLFIQLNSRLN